jgi:hypothetical protein
MTLIHNSGVYEILRELIALNFSKESLSKREPRMKDSDLGWLSSLECLLGSTFLSELLLYSSVILGKSKAPRPKPPVEVTNGSDLVSLTSCNPPTERACGFSAVPEKDSASLLKRAYF